MEEEEMKIGGLSNKAAHYRNVILAVLLVGWIVFCICTLIQIVNDYSPTPEEEAFSAWIKEFDRDVERPSRGMISFNAGYGVREPPRITDEEVKTYLSQVRLTNFEFIGYDISIRSVAVLLDNAFTKEFFFFYVVDGEHSGLFLDVRSKGARRFIQKEILRLAEAPEKDFQTLMFPEKKLDTKEVFLDDDSE
ncbi:MAG: hypothetical protein II807_10695 [Thermoguttaceae bacterium]|nr:hypothetical protein [Thermoguttaceae bacterium]